MTLGRGFDRCLTAVTNPHRETWVALSDEPNDSAARPGLVAAFAILCLEGAFVGYVQTLAVREDWRNAGLGTALLACMEERIFRDSPNVFICVSSFNKRARALYERLGYVLVGDLRDFIVSGHDEVLLRKTRGPLSDFNRQESRAAPT